MNMYLKELKSYRKATIFWSLGIVFFMLASMSKYEGYSKAGVSVNEIFEGLPAGFSSFMGANIIDLQTAGGWFAICVLYLSVMLGVHAVLLGSGIIGKEETDRTIEFLFAKPVSRNLILVSKILAAFTIIAALNIVTLLVSLVTVAAFNEGPSISGDIVFMMPSLLFIQLLFLTVGISFAAVMRRPKRSGMLSAAVLLATFIISAFVDITDRYDFLKYVTPFQYFDPKTIFADHAYNAIYILITITAIAIAILFSGFAYKNRDFSI